MQNSVQSPKVKKQWQFPLAGHMVRLTGSCDLTEACGFLISSGWVGWSSSVITFILTHICQACII